MTMAQLVISLLSEVWLFRRYLVVASVQTIDDFLGDIEVGVEVYARGFEQDCVITLGLVVLLDEVLD